MRAGPAALMAALIVVLALLAWTPEPPLGATTPVERGLAALHAAGARDATVVEAVVAAGLDPTDWDGRDVLHAVAVPALGDDPVAPLREAYAVLSAGADAHAWDDPVRGRVDLAAELLENVPGALASGNDAAQSFQLLAMAAGGLADEHADAVAALRERLFQLQADDGAWGCGPWHGPECTAFALAALSATGGIPADVRTSAAGYIMSRFQGAAFGDPLEGADVQVTAWAVQGLWLAGAPVPAATEPWILSQQRPDGMWAMAGRPSAWATAEVIVMLSGGHPLTAPAQVGDQPGALR